MYRSLLQYVNMPRTKDSEGREGCTSLGSGGKAVYLLTKAILVRYRELHSASDVAVALLTANLAHLALMGPPGPFSREECM